MSTHEPTVASKSVKPACIAIVGMHRSGTSATTSLVMGHGLVGPRPDDLVPAAASNELGHWESRTVIRYNSQVLRSRGGTGYDPPPATSGWGGESEYDDLRQQAALWFTETSAGKSVVMKDPRLCLTLPFWRSALTVPFAAVLALRDPMSVARSLQARDNLPIILGLAIWDRYVRSASLGLVGMPTLVVEYDAMLANPGQASADVASFLDLVGVRRETDNTAAERLEPSLRHHADDHDSYGDLGHEQREVFRSLWTFAGIHETWEPPVLPAAPAWVDDVFQLRRDYESAMREYRYAANSRTYRVHARLKRLLGLPVTQREAAEQLAQGRRRS
jgi:hypothetical protein